MNKLKFIPLVILLFINIIFVSAEEINPTELTFNDVLWGGYVEETIIIEISAEEEVYFQLSTAGPITDWLTLDKTTFTATKNKPAQFKLTVQPPQDAPLGIHEGLIIMSAYSKGNKITSTVNSLNIIRIKIDITNKEITEADIINIDTKDSEETYPIESTIKIKNKGNTLLQPKTTVNILDTNGYQLITHTQEAEIKPTLEESISILTPSENLAPGQYQAEIKVTLNNQLLQQALIPFELFKKGSLITKGQLVEINNEVYSNPDQTININALFENQGELPLSAQFIAQIYLDQELIQEIKSQPKTVGIGETITLSVPFTPQQVNTYIIKGYVLYEGKQSNTAESYLNVGPEEYISLSATPLLIVVFIALALFLFSRLKKKRKLVIKFQKRKVQKRK